MTKSATNNYDKQAKTLLIQDLLLFLHSNDKKSDAVHVKNHSFF